MDHINHLKLEVEELTRKITQYDSGNIKTAIEVLNQRIKELENEHAVLDSSYPDGDGYWK